MISTITVDATSGSAGLPAWQATLDTGKIPRVGTLQGEAPSSNLSVGGRRREETVSIELSLVWHLQRHDPGSDGAVGDPGSQRSSLIIVPGWLLRKCGDPRVAALSQCSRCEARLAGMGVG